MCIYLFAPFLLGFLNGYFLGGSNDEGIENLYTIDVNAYEIDRRRVDGEIIAKKITMLDFIDDVLADPEKAINYNTNEIKSLREVIIDYYGAKKGSELPPFGIADFQPEWDSATAVSNEKRYGISFDSARSVFLDEDAVLLHVPRYFRANVSSIIIGRGNDPEHLLVIQGIATGSGRRKITSASRAGPEAAAVYQAKGASTEIEGRAQ